ncbi:hypothetical protein Sjap_008754 [Stephania japonica]|uniref:Pectinesterase inhibitor domain-containing protein n=1 Tax=Stephania japonica TaxID=461633 RepID=A0AAP0PEY3_9MAGN
MMIVMVTKITTTMKPANQTEMPPMEAAAVAAQRTVKQARAAAILEHNKAFTNFAFVTIYRHPVLYFLVKLRTGIVCEVILCFHIPPLLCLSHGVTCKDIVAETCKEFNFVDYKLCLAILNPDPKSHNADLHRLEVITIRVIQTNASHLSMYVATLLRDGRRGGRTRSALHACLELYEGTAVGMQKAKYMKAKNYSEVHSELSSAVQVPDAYEQMFKKMKVKSVSTKQNEIFTQLTVIGIALYDMLTDK